MKSENVERQVSKLIDFISSEQETDKRIMTALAFVVVVVVVVSIVVQFKFENNNNNLNFISIRYQF